VVDHNFQVAAVAESNPSASIGQCIAFIDAAAVSVCSMLESVFTYQRSRAAIGRPPASVHKRCSAASVPIPPGDYVAIEIADTGIGMRAEIARAVATRSTFLNASEGLNTGCRGPG
jgi:hypothetical protein